MVGVTTCLIFELTRLYYINPVLSGTVRELCSIYYCATLGMGGTQNFVHGIYREKIPRYRVYRGTCFVVVVTKAKHAQQSN